MILLVKIELIYNFIYMNLLRTKKNILFTCNILMITNKIIII